MVRSASILLLLAGLLAGCNRTDASPAGSAPAEVRLGYFANLTHAQAVLGVASGDYALAIAPAKLKTQIFNAGPSLIEALDAGEIDIGYIGPGPVLSANARSHGESIRVIAGAAANGVVIVARKDSGIKTLADLKGKRVATPQAGNTQDISARHYLTAVLGQTDTDNVMAIATTEQPALLAAGQIDAAWDPEPWGAMLIAQTGATLVAEEKDLWPNKTFGLTVVVTTPEFLQRHPDIVKKFLAVHARWTDQLNADPQKYAPQIADALAKLTGKKLSPEIISKALTRLKFINDPDPQTLTTMADWSHELKVMRDPPNLNGLVDTTLLREVLAPPATH